MNIAEKKKIRIEKSPSTKINDIDWNNLGFGRKFADHIFVADYIDGEWQPGKILPYSPMPFEPALCTLHYGQTIFEGLKAYKDFNGGINIFRPDMNAERMVNSAKRLVMPEYPVEDFINACVELVKVDKNWIPSKRGHSLYLRPVMFGTGNFLGVHSSDTFRFIIMTSPVASYYAQGMSPVNILITHDYVRTVRGGLGAAKTASNYAASLLAVRDAKSKGFDQVLWLDGVEQKYIDEVGAMNVMFVIGDELITPSLEDGAILPGVTRRSILDLADEKKWKAVERKLSVDELFEEHRKGNLKEAFGTGTAALITPIGKLTYKDKQIIINNNEIGPIAQDLYDTLLGLMHGEIQDTRKWVVHINE